MPVEQLKSDKFMNILRGHLIEEGVPNVFIGRQPDNVIPCMSIFLIKTQNPRTLIDDVGRAEIVVGFDYKYTPSSTDRYSKADAMFNTYNDLRFILSNKMIYNDEEVYIIHVKTMQDARIEMDEKENYHVVCILSFVIDLKETNYD